jgi:molecular chaperone GrpE
MNDEIEKKEPEVDTDPGDDPVVDFGIAQSASSKNNTKIHYGDEYQDDVVFEDMTENLGGDYKKKTDQLKAKIKELEEKANNYLESWQRDKAEFINIRKRDEQAQKEFLKFANEKLIMDIIPVLDTFDIALSHAEGEVKKGIEGIISQLNGVLEKNGVTKFSPLGEQFDPIRAQAVATAPGEEGKVLDVMQSGYELGGRIIRPAIVTVGE